MKCNGGNHNLKVVAVNSIDSQTDQVIRWCRTCGSVVGDVDVDGRIYPGRVFKMLHPEHKTQAYSPSSEGGK